MLQKSRLQAHLLAQNSGPVSSLSLIETTIFWVKIPLVRQLLIYVTLSLRAVLGRSAAAAPNQSTTHVNETETAQWPSWSVCAWQGTKVHQRHVWTEYVPRTTLRQVGSRILLCISI